VSATRSQPSRVEGPAPPVGSDTAILARWPGRCPYCVRRIQRGDLIVKVAEQWLHDDCDKAAKDAE
jgi:hypothetical protein